MEKCTFSLSMAIDKSGYHEIAWRGSFGEGGKEAKAAVTLEIRTCDIFSYLDKVYKFFV